MVDTPSQRSRARFAGPVVDLDRARSDRRLLEAHRRLREVLEVNRKALGGLFQSGLIYTRHGARLGRDLLLAQQHLIKVRELLARLGELDGLPAEGAEGALLHRQVQVLLARTAELTARSDGVLARER
ncbi:MAG TPA: hypothetical protein VFE30_04905 [Anaeromyxobacteraceae bacterium]|jgi:hypothetical protein|nr:hypothetical protein [Anaeromyxobacteraceae bacterium]